MMARFDTMPDGRRVRLWRGGQGPPLLLLHGYPDNLHIWGRLAPLLAARHDVIAFDWPGLGASDPWSGGVTPMHLADRLARLLDHWEIASATVVGADMGGQPALAFAALHQARCTRAVVMNSLVMGDEATSWEIRVLRRFGFNRLLLGRLPRLVFMRALRTFGARPDPDVVADMWDTFRRPSVRKTLVRMCAGYQATFPRLRALYDRVQCPVTIAWGEHDRHFPVQQAHALHAVLPTSTLKIIQGAHHWMMWDRADALAAALTDG